MSRREPFPPRAQIGQIARFEHRLRMTGLAIKTQTSPLMRAMCAIVVIEVGDDLDAYPAPPRKNTD
jgi:hypothetical protein